MEKPDHGEAFANGATFTPTGTVVSRDVSWIEHPAWPGVALKDLMTKSDTGEAFGYHLVRVDEGCEVGVHAHPDEWEWNGVLAGEGSFFFEEHEIPFTTGASFVTPPGVDHRVCATGGEVLLLALFIPGPG
ncbi:quercetin dioxygenase-like cupin family protein [Methanofollis sp. W23]|uniref:cupin domain-containing protein n=1 Tax=Methanofollis sp. W23 TaxID=2817849 RepID=UPI001AE6CFA1|nr:cupin domain-containing protein [Methanofollis sp. W23]MBP2144815.1 quercetin dioxygenase-like cupin family protein [Methanofollis sp. W23]